MVGSKIAAGHHDSRFDFDESALAKAAALLTLQTMRIAEVAQRSCRFRQASDKSSEQLINRFL